MLIIVLLSLACAGCVGIPSAGRGLPINRSFPLNSAFLMARMDSPTSSREGGIGTYFKDRANDFVDIFGFSLSVGMGIQANARVTQAIQGGGWFWGGARFGFIGREGGAWSETVYELGFPGFYLRSVEIIPGSGNIKRVNTERGQSMWVFCGEKGAPYDSSYDRKFWQVGATVHAGLLGVDFSVNLKELLDFLIGWTTIDISRDDTGNRPPTPSPEEEESGNYQP